MYDLIVKSMKGGKPTTVEYITLTYADDYVCVPLAQETLDKQYTKWPEERKAENKTVGKYTSTPEWKTIGPGFFV